MRRILSACALVGSVFTLAACSPEPAADDAAAAPAASAAKRLPLPDCAAVSAEDKGAEGWKHPDCRLMVPGDANLAFEARYTAAEDETTLVTIQIVQPGDATLQTFEETMGNTFEPPSTQDVDMDGLTDILIPLETGNVNTAWAIWRQTAAPQFVRAGELSGVSIFTLEDKLIAVQARSSAVAWSVPVYRMDGDTLVHIVTADIQAKGDDTGNISSTACSVVAAEGMASAGFTLESAKARFCAEPVVAEIFK